MGPYFRLSFCWKFLTYAIGRYYYLHFTNKKAETQAARLRPHRKGATEPGTLNPVTGTPRSLLVPPTPPLGFSPTLSGVACEAGCSTTVRFSVIAAGGRASGSLKANDPGKGCGGRVCSFLRSVTHFTAPCSRQSGHGLAASHRRPALCGLACNRRTCDSAAAKGRRPRSSATSLSKLRQTQNDSCHLPRNWHLLSPSDTGRLERYMINGPILRTNFFFSKNKWAINGSLSPTHTHTDIAELLSQYPSLWFQLTSCW